MSRRSRLRTLPVRGAVPAALLIGGLLAPAAGGWVDVGPPEAKAHVMPTAGQDRPPAVAGASRAARDSSWRPVQPSKVARTEVSAAAIGRDVYVLGGYASASTPTREVERYDTRRDRWRRVAPMPVAVNHAAAVSYRGELYVLGGYSGTPFSLGIGTGGVADATSAFFRYTPERDRWTRMPPAPTARAAMAATVIGHRLYAAGGANALRPMTTLEIFDFKRRRWRTGPNMPLATEHTAGTALDGDLYVVSGRPFYGGGTNSFVQRYRPRAERWRRVADVRHGRGGFAAVTACGRVIAFGGEDPGRGPPGTVPEVEGYRPARDLWRPLPSMRTPRHGLAGVAVGDRLYALEGGDVTFLSITATAETLHLRCAPRSSGQRPHRFTRSRYSP